MFEFFKCFHVQRIAKKMTDDEIDKAVKIEGTQHDRKRKLTDKEIKRIKKYVSNGKMSYRDFSKIYGVDVRTIRYACDDEYRLSRISQSNGKHYGVVNFDKANRISYKKYLIGSFNISEVTK